MDNNDQDIKQLRVTKLSELESSFQAALNNKNMFINVDGMAVTCGEDAIANCLELYSKCGIMSKVEFKDYENRPHNINREQLMSIYSALVLWRSNLFKAKWRYEQQIDSIFEISELKALKFTF